MSKSLSFSFDTKTINNISYITNKCNTIRNIVDTMIILDINGINKIGTANSNKEIVKDADENYIISYELSVVFSNVNIPGVLTLHFEYFYPNLNSMDYNDNDFQVGTKLGSVVGTKSSGHFLNSAGIATQLVERNHSKILYNVLFEENKEDKPDFLWGASTSAFQVEGTSNSYGRGLTIWDTFINQVPSPIANDSNADYACNSYRQYKDDIQAVKTFNGNSYRFSISWSRIFPNGKGEINQQGVSHYSDVINECLLNNITPIVCLYHWDLPQALQDEYNGWLCKNGEIWIDFMNYAAFCFQQYGDRVKYWATINEPQTIAVDCYEYNYYAPAQGTSNGDSIYGYEYTAAYNLLISHAYAVNIYRKKFNKQNGKIGIICNMDWGEPYTNDPSNVAAAERRNVFWGGWFWDPIFFGDYPQIMKELVGDRLPKFTTEQSALIQGSIDIFFLNTYSSEYIYNENYSSSNLVGWTYDQRTAQSYYNPEGIIIGAPTQSSWLHIVPWGVNKLLLWIQNRYSYNGCGSGIGIYKNGIKTRIPLMITENGMDILNQTQDTPYSVAKNDYERIYYYESYLTNIADAVKTGGIDFKGYFPWSLLDNFEWSSAYTCRFGLFYLDCNKDTYIERKPKNSVFWYKNYIENNPAGPIGFKNEKKCDFYDENPNLACAWSGGVIRGYYYWSSNFYNPPFTPKTSDLYCLNTITTPQTNINPPSTYTDITQKSYAKQYTSHIVNETNFNAIFIFTQYTNYNDIVNNANIPDMYNNAISYFSEHNINNFLIGLCFGSGVGPSSPPIPGEGDGFFTLGQNGSIASIYTAITSLNQTYSYVQSNNEIITITGTGSYTYGSSQPGQYNCILFDIELATTSGTEMVNTSDFTNLFKYIKDIYPEMIIITAISHSCSNYIPTISSEIIKSSLSDYIAPILYTQMFGTTNEYCANSNLSWLQFFERLSLNQKFIKYGLNYLLPNIYSGYSFTTLNQETILDMYNNGGTNTGRPPNLYYYQSSSSADSEVVESYRCSADSEVVESYICTESSLEFVNKDEGAVNFFNKLLKNYNINTEINSSNFLGGFIQWSNYYSSSYNFTQPHNVKNKNHFDY